MATVLIVDDNDINRDLVRTVLTGHGHDVLEAEDGEQALTTMREEQVDLAILDVLMPGMDGYELTREIRAHPETADVRVVFYTANFLEEEALPIAASLGVSRIIAKTGSTVALIETVRAALAEPPTVTAPVAEPAFGREHLRVLNTKLLAKIDELEQKERLHQLLDAAVSVGQDLSLSVTLDRIITAARSLVVAEHVVVQLTDEDGRPGPSAHTTGDGVADIDNVGRGADGPGSTALTVSIRIGERDVGSLRLVGKRDGTAYTVEDENLVVSLAAVAGRAISNAQTYERTRRREAWLSASIEVTAALLAAEPSEALQLVARAARRVTAASAAWILLPAPDDQVRIAACDGALVDRYRGRVFARTDAGFYAELAATGRPAVLDDTRSDELTADHMRTVFGVGPLLAVPLLAGERYLGALVVGNEGGGNRFSTTDLSMASAFARRAALSLEVAHSVEGRHRATTHRAW